MKHAPLISAALAVVVTLAVVLPRSDAAAPAEAPTPAAVLPMLASGLPTAVPGPDGVQPLPSLAPVIKQAGPAVVNISTRTVQQLQRNPFFDDPFFRRFFGAPDQPRERESQSLGSGVIVDSAKGYVLTNHHVVADAREITVTLQDDRSFKAKLIGSDERTDLAVVQLEGAGFKSLPLGDSDRLEVGDFVIAIGNPFGLDHTVTSGIVSGLGRAGLNSENYEDFIQTDASINPGNSGGALINLRGELVGINTAILSRSGGNIGIGFAIPINMAKSVMNQIIEFGKVERGMLGVTGQDLTPELAKALDTTVREGTVINTVSPGSPADKAGLKPGDIVTALNGKAVASFQELRNRVGLMRKGDKVKLDAWRDGKKVAVTATLGDVTDGGVSADGLHPALEGVSFGEISESSPQYGRLRGVQITEVDPESGAARRGLQAGDVVVAVGRRPIANLDEFRTAMRAVGGNPFALNVRRGNVGFYVTFQ
jgi:Do/DeqQ family serine protease